jgi:hypothetical protein
MKNEEKNHFEIFNCGHIIYTRNTLKFEYLCPGKPSAEPENNRVPEARARCMPILNWLFLVMNITADCTTARAKKYLISQIASLKKLAWIRSQRQKIWLDESPRLKSTDRLSSRCPRIWSDEKPRVILSDSLNSGPETIWLHESWSDKTSDWLNSQPGKNWLEEIWVMKLPNEF